MRAFVATLWQNTGTLAAGNYNTVSTHLVKVGTLDNTLDEELTKMQPGDMTVELEDPDDSIWAFIQTQLAIQGGLLPPWLQLLVGGTQRFLGTVDPSRIVRHLAGDKHSIELGAQDWSLELSNVYLGSPSAPLWQPNTPAVIPQQCLANGSVYQCIAPGTSASSGAGPTGQTTCTDGGITWQWVPPTWTRPVPRLAANRATTSSMTGYSTWLKSLAYGGYLNDVLFAGAPNQVSIGDKMTCTLAVDSGLTFTVLNVQSPPDPGIIPDLGTPKPYPSGTLTQVTLNASPWLGNQPFSAAFLASEAGGFASSGISASFTRLSSSTTDAIYFTVQTAVGPSPSPNVYTIDLDTVDGIMPMDTLKCIHGLQAASWKVLSIDPELRRVTVKEAVTNLNIGDEIYFDDATNAELVMMDARVLIAAASQPYSVDFSRFVKASLPMPVFGWLVSQSMDQSEALLPVSDIEPSSSGQVRLICGFTNAFHGGPDLGWTSESPVSLPTTQPQYADWTRQRATAPSSLMPYTVNTDSPFARRRNRTYSDTNSNYSFTFTSVDNGPTPTGGAQSTWVDSWTSAMGSTIPAQIFYDYLQMRKLVVASGGHGLNAYAWSGSAFGGASALTWPTGNALESLCNFPGGPTGALLAVTTANTLELALFPGSASCAIPSYLQGGVLVPTPYGPYLIGPKAYGQITYSGGVLAINATFFTDIITCFWPNTFVARAATEAVIMGRLDVSQVGSSNPITESWLYRLTLPPNSATPNASILLSEKIADGSPVFAGAILDPTKAGRVVGHWGGRPWQFDTQMPWTVERFTPSGMTAQECIEHVCQLNNAMAIPQASGFLAIVSRSISESPIALTVLQVTNDQSLAWANFYSIVRCTLQDGQTYYDANGAQNGGNLLEISNQPMLWTLSQAGAMAESYAAWFGRPRPTETHSWTYPDANTAPPWEGLPPFARITLNGTGPWRVLSTTQDFVEGTCKAVLVED